MLIHIALLFSAFVLDSTIYSVDIERGVVDEIEFSEAIIDYVADDFIYAVTRNYLYKIDPGRAVIIDKTPLPLRFNYILLRRYEIILISTDEIIVLDRKNLAFKSGIGIDPGDHKPIVKNQTLVGLPGPPTIILMSEAGTHNTIRSVDIGSGRTTARVTVNPIKDAVYDHQNSNFIMLEQGQTMLVLNPQMKIQHRVNLGFDARRLANRNEALYVSSDDCVFLLTKKGRLIDFQPLTAMRDIGASIILTDDGVFWLDSLTFRISGWLQNNDHMTQLYADASSDRIIGIDIHDQMHLIEKSPGRALKLANYRRDLAQKLPASPRVDSLWFLQLAAFSDPSNAGQMYEEFREKQIPVFIDTTDLYRIKFGGFTDKTVALDLQEKMELDGWFVFEPRKYGDNSEVFYVGVEKFVIDKGIVGKE